MSLSTFSPKTATTTTARRKNHHSPTSHQYHDHMNYDYYHKYQNDNDENDNQNNDDEEEENDEYILPTIGQFHMLRPPSPLPSNSQQQQQQPSSFYNNQYSKKFTQLNHQFQLRQEWKHLYVLPVLLLEFLAVALTRAVLPSILLQEYGKRTYLVLGFADCIRGCLAFWACPLFGKISDVWGRKLCLFVTVLGSCAPVCSLALFKWKNDDNNNNNDIADTIMDFDITDPTSSSILIPLEDMPSTTSTSTSGSVGDEYYYDQDLIQQQSPFSNFTSISTSTNINNNHNNFHLEYSLPPMAIPLFVTLLSLSGIFSSTFTLVFAYISDTVKTREDRVAAYGLALATFGLSFTIGPMAGGYLAQYNTHYVFLSSFALTIVDLLYIYFVLPESKTNIISQFKTTSTSSTTSTTSDNNNNKTATALLFSTSSLESSLRLILQDPFLRKVGQVAFFYYTGLWAVISTLSLYAVQHFHLSPERLGELMSALGLCTMIAEAVLVRILVPYIGEKKSTRLGLASFALQCLVLGFAYESWHLFICVAFSLLGNLVYPSLSSLVSSTVEPDSVGEALGAMNGIKALTEGIGPLLFGALMTISSSDDDEDDDGDEGSTWYFPGWPYWIAAIFVMISYHIAGSLPDGDYDDDYYYDDEEEQDEDDDNDDDDNCNDICFGNNNNTTTTSRSLFSFNRNDYNNNNNNNGHKGQTRQLQQQRRRRLKKEYIHELEFKKRRDYNPHLSDNTNTFSNNNNNHDNNHTCNNMTIPGHNNNNNNNNYSSSTSFFSKFWNGSSSSSKQQQQQQQAPQSCWDSYNKLFETPMRDDDYEEYQALLSLSEIDDDEIVSSSHSSSSSSSSLDSKEKKNPTVKYRDMPIVISATTTTTTTTTTPAKSSFKPPSSSPSKQHQQQPHHHHHSSKKEKQKQPVERIHLPHTTPFCRCVLPTATATATTTTTTTKTSPTTNKRSKQSSTRTNQQNNNNNNNNNIPFKKVSPTILVAGRKKNTITHQSERK